MDKTRKKKLKKGAGKPVEKAIVKDTQQAPAEEKTFDFGGLPDRELKKNLGCG